MHEDVTLGVYMHETQGQLLALYNDSIFGRRINACGTDFILFIFLWHVYIYLIYIEVMLI